MKFRDFPGSVIEILFVSLHNKLNLKFKLYLIFALNRDAANHVPTNPVAPVIRILEFSKPRSNFSFSRISSISEFEGTKLNMPASLVNLNNCKSNLNGSVGL